VTVLINNNKKDWMPINDCEKKGTREITVKRKKQWQFE